MNTDDSASNTFQRLLKLSTHKSRNGDNRVYCQVVMRLMANRPLIRMVRVSIYDIISTDLPLAALYPHYNISNVF